MYGVFGRVFLECVTKFKFISWESEGGGLGNMSCTVKCCIRSRGFYQDRFVWEGYDLTVPGCLAACVEPSDICLPFLVYSCC